MEEKERNKVNKALPRVEQELEQLIGDWERLHQVGGCVSCLSRRYDIHNIHGRCVCDHLSPFLLPDTVSGGGSLPEGLHRGAEAGT